MKISSTSVGSEKFGPVPASDLCSWLRNQRRLLTEVDLENLGIAPKRTWQSWRLRGGGPKFIRLAGTGSRGLIRYDTSTIAAWLEGGTRTSTSDRASDTPKAS